MRVIALLGDLAGAAVPQIIGRCITGRRHAVIDDEWLHGALLYLRIGLRSRGAGEQRARLLAHHHLAVRRAKDRQQADLELRPADAVPGNPDAVRSADFRGAVMCRQLLRREDKLSIGLAIFPHDGVVEAIDDELPFDRHGLIFLVVEIQPAAEAAHARLARHVVHRRRPQRDNPRRRLIEILFLLLGIGIPEFLPALADRPALGLGRCRAGQRHSTKQHDQQIAQRAFHFSHP